jgi:hypothetical protein
MKILNEFLKYELHTERKYEIVSSLRLLVDKEQPLYKWNIEPGTEIKPEEGKDSAPTSPEKTAPTEECIDDGNQADTENQLTD